jgi:hypothetical protein
MHCMHTCIEGKVNIHKSMRATSHQRAENSRVCYYSAGSGQRGVRECVCVCDNMCMCVCLCVRQCVSVCVSVWCVLCFIDGDVTSV